MLTYGHVLDGYVFPLILQALGFVKLGKNNQIIGAMKHTKNNGFNGIPVEGAEVEGCKRTTHIVIGFEVLVLLFR